MQTHRCRDHSRPAQTRLRERDATIERLEANRWRLAKCEKQEREEKERDSEEWENVKVRSPQRRAAKLRSNATVTLKAKADQDVRSLRSGLSLAALKLQLS